MEMGLLFPGKVLVFFFFFFSLLFLSLTDTIVATLGPKQREIDRISVLPGQPPVPFNQFSGYVTVNEQDGRALFYWLTEATTFPEKKPLVLWLNGGPGCSSVAYGASEEIGPFRINRTGQSLYRNKYSWNTDNYYDSIGTVTFWWTHSMISDQTYQSILKHCNFSAEEASKHCDNAVSYAMNHEFGDIDQYSIYTPSCMALPNKTMQIMRLKNTLLRRRVTGYDPCTENYAEKYYNRPDVQKALHANTTGIPYKWTACSDVLLKYWTDSENSILPTYKNLIEAGLRIWVFSGDTDSVVPVTATRFSLSHLNLKIKTRWYPWYSGRQVGGWTEVYDGLTFATVRGAGHEVPLFQPKRAFILFRSFVRIGRKAIATYLNHNLFLLDS
ncbi:hypothetical protein FEM48_Zijuj01G0171500 [Ziziphus jujuba var. spinosa]|uniref:Uncharacterized protein n=1 Tax=Ziziphus jujuba var. spinosa TaxID=714518 RepID=A0A978W2I1_ZIZJJ|nr:hypothetical protein FEM48_Zijuj01G0171500 [Ziziphus jujuba var. spinosa]